MSTELSEKIISLRTHAANIYDRGLREGMKADDIAIGLEPITRKLSELITEATVHNVPGLAVAVKRLENQSKCYLKDAEYFKQKADDAMYHVHVMKMAMAMRMKELNVETHEADGYIVTRDPKTDQITFR